MKTALLAVVALFAVGCGVSNSAARIVAPDGRPAVVVECDHGTMACYTKISSMCPSGYEVLNQDQEQDSSSRGFATRRFAGVRSDSHAKTTMIVECKGGQAPINVDDACSKDPLMRSNMEMAVDCGK